MSGGGLLAHHQRSFVSFNTSKVSSRFLVVLQTWWLRALLKQQSASRRRGVVTSVSGTLVCILGFVLSGRIVAVPARKSVAVFFEFLTIIVVGAQK